MMLTNWKTTVAGIVLVLVQFAVWKGWIDKSVGDALTGLLAAAGFVAAADAAKKP